MHHRLSRPLSVSSLFSFIGISPNKFLALLTDLGACFSGGLDSPSGDLPGETETAEERTGGEPGIGLKARLIS